MSRARWGTLLFLGVLVFATFYDLGGRNLHDIDTARWGQLAREMIRSGEWLVPTRYGELYVNKPPLYLWCVAGPAQLAGEVTPFLARLPSALGLFALVLLTAWWTRMRTGSAGTARIAALLVLSTAAVAWLGRGARLDMMASALAVAAAAVLDRAALGLGTRRTPWIAGLLVGAALLTKGPPLLLVPAAVLFASSRDRTLGQRLRAARPLLVVVVGFAIALLWFVPAVRAAGWEPYGQKLLIGQAAERITGTLDQSQAAWYYLLTVPALFALWGLGYLAAAAGSLIPRVRRSLGPAASLTVAGACVLVIFSLIPTKHVRYLVPVVPLFAMALACWFRLWWRRPARARWDLHLRALAGVCALAVIGLVVAGSLQAGALPGLLGPALAFAALAVVAWRSTTACDLRRRFVTCALYGLVLVMLTQGVVRPRFHDGNKQRFNRRLAELRTGDVPVWIAHGMVPENVFHGAPEARYFLDPAEPVPGETGERTLVVCLRDQAAALRRADGTPGRILDPGAGRESWVIVGFGYP